MIGNRTKKAIGLCLVLMLTISVEAQESARITYVRKMNLHKLLPKSQEMLKSMIPEFKKDKITLLYNKQYGKITEKQIGSSGGAVVQMGGGGEALYLNRQKQTNINFIKLGDKLYGAESEAKEKLELVKETKVIQGYTCYKAIGKSNIQASTSVNNGEASTTEKSAKKKTETVYWYCKDLPKGLSPMGYLNLPGCVLAVESDAMEYTLESIKKETMSEEEIALPENWKSITSEQLMDLQEEQLEELQNLH